MNIIKKSLVVLSLTAIANIATAEQISGYVSEILTGPSETKVFHAALIGMSDTDGGAVSRYMFTSDAAYLNMMVNAQVNHKPVIVGYTEGSLTAVYYK